MEPKFDVEHSEDSKEDQYTVSNIPQRPSRWSYLAASGLVLGWLAEVQLFSQSGLLLTVINEDLGPEKQYPWIFESFLFVAAILSPSAGALADHLGRRWFVVVGNLIAIVGGIICATAQSVNVVIVGMAIAGLGTTGQHFVFAGISELFPRKDRGFAQGALQFATFPFTACGVILAAEMVTHSTWRWTYYLYILISGLALFVTFFFYDPPVPEKEFPTLQYLLTLDWLQPFLITFGVGSLAVGGGFAIFGINRWSSSAVLVPMFCGFGIIALGICRIRYYRGSNPLFPREIFNKEMLSIVLIGSLISFPVYAVTFIWTSEAQSLYTTNLVQIGKYNFPAGFGTEVGVFLSALIMRKLGRTHLQLATACFFIVLFTTLLATLTPNSVRPGLAYLSLAGVANGFIQVLIMAMVQLTNPDQHIGAVTGLFLLGRYLAGAAAILMSLTILRSHVGFTLVSNVAKATLPLGLPETSLPLLLGAVETANAQMIMQVPGVTPEIIEAATMAIKNTYAHSFRIIYFPILGVGLAAIIIAFFFAPDVKSRMDNSLAVFHGRPWFLRRMGQKSS